MRIKNSEDYYGIVSIFLHWLLAILLIGLLIIGLYMVNLPVSLEKLKLYGWHKEYGLLALALAIIRIGWRLINITPRLSIPWLEVIAARVVHWSFYGFMFAMPITGWLITSAAGLPASLFGVVTLPDLVSPNPDLMQLFQKIHKWLGYALIVTIILHTSAALKHHFINKDDILRRMIS
jgi:cytochrome b561